MSAKQFRGAEHPNAVLLCIDDDETLLDCLKSLLERHGYCVLAASSGRGGLEILTAHAVDLVVLDYAMPGMNGPQVASAIKRMCPQTRIVWLPPPRICHPYPTNRLRVRT